MNGKAKIRAVKKEAKHYHYDWNLIDEESYRFENMVVCHLLKWCNYKQDYEGLDIELRYFRAIDRREVDFVLVKNNKPVQFVECKLRSKEVNPALGCLKKRFQKAKAVQISLDNDDYVNKDGVHVCPAEKNLIILI